MWRKFIVIVVPSSLVACSGNSSAPPVQVVDANSAEITAPPAVATPASATAPKHNWQFKEGDVYGYIAAVSEDDRKQGKVAGDVVMYRYGGFNGGLDHLEEVIDGGTVVATAECTRPCVAVKLFESNAPYGRLGGRYRRIAYDPASIVGSALQDAMNGYLVAKRPPPVRPVVTAAANEQEEAPEPVDHNAIVQELANGGN